MINNNDNSKFYYFMFINKVILCFIFALFLAYLIPDGKINSKNQIEPFWFKDNQVSPIGTRFFGVTTFIDCLELRSSINDTKYSASIYKNALQKVARSPDAGQSCENNSNFGTYPRFWHGIRLVIRPILFLFNSEVLLKFNFFCVIFSFGYFLAGLTKEQSLAVVISFMFFGVESVFFTLTQSPNWIIAFIASGLVLRRYEHDFILKVFLVAGFSSIFFEMLFDPTITLTLPLLCLLLNQKLPFNLLIKSVVFWLFGFIYTWFLKWLLFVMISHDYTFFHELASYIYGYLPINEYKNSQNNPVDFQGVIEKVLSCVHLPCSFKWKIIYLFGIPFMGLLVIKNFKRKIIAMTFVILLPLVVYFILRLHSSWHAFIVHRLLLPNMIIFILTLFWALKSIYFKFFGVNSLIILINKKLSSFFKTL